MGEGEMMVLLLSAFFTGLFAGLMIATLAGG
jgi:hypothetical protein